MSGIVFQNRNGRISAFIDNHCTESRQPILGKEVLRITLSDAEAKMSVKELARRFVNRVSDADK